VIVSKKPKLRGLAQSRTFGGRRSFSGRIQAAASSAALGSQENNHDAFPIRRACTRWAVDGPRDCALMTFLNRFVEISNTGSGSSLRASVLKTPSA
jgi:hypothetical protein